MTLDQAPALIQQHVGVSPTVAAATPATLEVDVPVERWAAFGEFARHTLGCAFFSFLSAVDWKDGGLEVVARVESCDAGFAVMMRTRVGPAAEAVCPSIVPVYRGADWMERECFDLFGIRFDGHPDLRRILLPDDWVGHPLLKSYAVDTPHPPYR
ncbi:MAG: NADH-quinone oxidoreductase subunit C [Acidobacteria bacterium]|nr:NADH-quinone oxidoreductase subunit C [Acidobacteriota bacterium]